MSQIIVPVLSNPPPPGFVISLTGNTGGAVGPDGSDNINVFGGSGVNISGNMGTHTLTVNILNSQTATTTTSDGAGQTQTILTFPLAATPTAYAFEARVAAIDKNNLSVGGFSGFCAVQTDGVTASILTDTDLITHETKTPITGINGATVSFSVSGNNAILQVVGVATHTINWGAFALYVSVDRSF